MKTLGNLVPNLGSNKSTKRKGRGIGSGLGKTAGKGHKGQKARKSGGPGAGFEGGQTPMYRRIPKHGFTNTRTKKIFRVINLAQFVSVPGITEFGPETFVKLGLAKNKSELIKVLSVGEVTTPIKVIAHKLSKNATEAIQKAGGSIEILKIENEPIEKKKK